ncbi:hypothetical protein [Photobacterium leiognathi]|uniref:hypothetical protein n=1 Tax=Photobacterium leiognathi TaxID=553611 RepID=UPI002980D81C|nr:hypothetical protein [Photobacterium leiognathi]
MNKIVLLGGSNSFKKNGLRKGLEKNCKLFNLSLGATSSLQNLYELTRNRKVISCCDLIVTESNVNDFHNLNLTSITIDNTIKHIELFYAKLYEFKRPVVVLIIPLLTKNFLHAELVNKVHRSCIEKYKFNFIDIQNFYDCNGLSNELNLFNLDHPLDCVMSEIGEYISHNNFKINYHDNLPILSKCKIIKLESTKIKSNSLLKESVSYIEHKYKINHDYLGYKVVGIHSWNDYPGVLTIYNLGNKISKISNTECQFNDISHSLYVDNETFFSSSYEKISEKSIRTKNIKPKRKHFNLIGIFLIKYNDNDFKNFVFYDLKRGLDNDFSFSLEFIIKHLEFNREYSSYLYEKTFLGRLKRKLKNILYSFR